MTAQHIESVAEFDALSTSTTFVVVDFYADWCPPCKMIAPMFAALAQSHSVEGKLAFAKVNVDSQQELAVKFGISAMPTFLLLKDGEPISNVRGANPPSIKALVKTAETELVAMAKKESKPEAAAEVVVPNEEEEGGKNKKADSETVSGGYTMSKGVRSDWKMSLGR